MASSASSSKCLPSLRARETLDDRISELPDSILVQILSHLPTDEAFRTSILSKRWKYIWTSLHNFNFIYYGGKLEQFDSFVDYVLAQSVSSKIKKFELYIPYEYRCNTRRWLSFAVERKVEHAVLSGYPYLSEAFCTCSSLITLDITHVKFPWPSMVISCKSLKSIKMENMSLSDYDFVKLLEGCPELESMELKYVTCFNRLEIKSLKLKRLYLEELIVDREDEDTSMETFAPYLEHFGISGDLGDTKFRLLDVSSLVSANLTYNNSCFNSTCKLSYDDEDDDDEDEDDDDDEESRQNYHQGFITLVVENLQKLSCVTELTLGSWFTELIGLPIPELKCKKLTLELDVKFNLYGAARILRALSHVETLNIHMVNRFTGSRCHFELRCLAEGDNIDMQSWISNFEFPNLKNFKIVSFFCLSRFNFEIFSQGFDKILKLSEFVLKNAKVLEKFVISKSIKCKECSMNHAFPGFDCLTKILSGRPRASSNCLIVFQE